MSIRHLVCALALLLAVVAVQAAPVFPRYRDLQVYTTSAPDKKNPAKIVAVTTFVNRGKAPLKIAATINKEKAVGFAGVRFYGTLAPGKRTARTWVFTPPDGVKRVVLTGDISINGRRERDLFLTVLGPDPADLKDDGLEKITERARVVATYAPRAQSSIEAELQTRAARQPKPLITLATGGKSAYAIVVSALPAPPPGREAMAYWKGAGLTAPQKELVDALDDLQRCLRVQSGVTLPITAKPSAPAIVLRQAELGAPAKGLQDAYRLKTEGNNVLIEAADLEGLRNGIYGLLTDHLQCHWFQPRALGEEIIVPKDRTVRLPALDEVKGSPWLSNGGASWGADRRWDLRTRGIVNRSRIWFGHSWNLYIAKEEFPYEKFPEYYARDREGKIRINDTADGGTFTNFCTTNPEVIEIVAKKVNAYFDANPDAILASLDPNDYAPFCLCDRCLALDKHYGQTKEDGTEVTDRILHFSKEIHDRLKPEHKDKYLGVLIYGFQIELPKSAKPHPHHAGYICNMGWTYDHSRPFNDPTSSFNRHFYDLVKGWGAIMPQMGFYDYYGHWAFYGPWAMVHKIREDIPAFHDLGGTYMVLEAQPNFAGQGLNHYICNLLARDLDADVDLALEELFRNYYGPAAAPMRSYWLGAERWYALERPSTNSYPRAIQHAEFWTELDGYLQAAQQAAANLPAGQKRYTERVQQARDAFEYGRFFYDYEQHYGHLARSRKQAIDHAAAIKYLQDNRAPAEAIRKKYAHDNPDYPILIPLYYVQDIDAMVKKHQDALAKK
ncbi:MAG: DUF4838 domain-containing protein [Armatimonadota bacterium]